MESIDVSFEKIDEIAHDSSSADAAGDTRGHARRGTRGTGQKIRKNGTKRISLGVVFGVFVSVVGQVVFPLGRFRAAVGGFGILVVGFS